MGKMTIKKRVQWISAALFLLIGGLAAYILLLYFYTDISKSSVGAARGGFAQLVEAVEQGDYNVLDSREGAYVSASGQVVKSSIPFLEEGSNVDLHRFSAVNTAAVFNGDSYFLSPLVKDGKLDGLLMLRYDSSRFTLFHRYGVFLFIPLFALLIGLIFLLAVGIRFIYRDIAEPLAQIRHVAKKILRREYSTRITYEYDGEIGELCHDLEELRDELYYTCVREERLKKNEKELLACISHDLKTPLASVSGYVEGIKSGVVKEPEQVGRYLDIIISKTRYISKLIDDILEHSKTELNEFNVHPKELYARKLFEEVLGDISIDVIQKGFRFSYKEIPDVLVWADKGRIVQVIQNIVDNSMKYTEKDGIISVDFALYEKELVIAVSDTGKGIPVGDLPFIFDKFYRGEKARTMNVPGSGLGLSIAQYIVGKHGGHIECDSVFQEGTTVRFSVKLC